MTDDLTGVFSRNMLEEHITQAMDQAKRYGHPCSLIFLDIDNFKQINDVHGHLVGDEVLKKVARLMLSAARKTDVVGRLGGEEFVLLLSGTALPGAVQHAERLRQDIAALLLPLRGQPQPLQ
ncbi:GGDEF domain-containing protein, partial [Enterococcus faecium]